MISNVIGQTSSEGIRFVLKSWTLESAPMSLEPITASWSVVSSVSLVSLKTVSKK